MKKLFGSLLLALIVFSCKTNLTDSGLDPLNFSKVVDGKEIGLFILKNTNGMEVCITNYGGRIVSLMVPDKNGIMQDVVLGFDSIDDYLKYPTDFGATIGRYANRIGQGKFTIDAKEYQLPKNNYGHCLHGGEKGFHCKIFDIDEVSDKKVVLSYLSKDGEEGFPGNLECEVSFELTDDNAVEISYQATTDKPTVINLTNHSYFNLDGGDNLSNSKHLLKINADHYTPVDETFMTTGEIVTVENTDMDFRVLTPIGTRIDNYSFDQLKNGRGYDHNWVLNAKGDVSVPSAQLESVETGIIMDLYTTEPGVQFYAGNFLDGSLRGKNGVIYKPRASICLETQKYPDAPNKPNWPSAMLRPDGKYYSKSIFKFSVKE